MATQSSSSTSSIRVVPLGAGQDVGRSCVVVSLGGRTVMFDCGMHMGYQDERRFPDFTHLAKATPMDQVIDAVIITHFHLDHCGALPYFTEMVGFSGPVFMTHPTKAICPILLEDYRKISVERRGLTDFYTSKNIQDCMDKVRAVHLHETVYVGDDMEVKAYYAGHVLGAAMFYVRVGEESVVYTGDYNMTPDRHLGAASIDKLRPDLLITETTYGTTIRDSKRQRERDLLKRIHECVKGGGKVLIPVFALGRAQELCILVESYWQRMNLKVPVYFSQGLTQKANFYYRLFIGWTNQKIKQTFAERNMFDFKHIKPFERSMADKPGPMVLFATPGMLHAGLSLDVFKKWAGDERNMVIIPGYCVVGTVGNKLLAGRRQQTRIEVEKGQSIDVKCKIRYLSFSAHADAKGILQLVRQLEPRNIMLVHGEKSKMQTLKQKIMSEFRIPCYDPPNGTSIEIRTRQSVLVHLSKSLLEQQFYRNTPFDTPAHEYRAAGQPGTQIFGQQHAQPVSGVLVMRGDEPPRVLNADDAAEELGVCAHQVRVEVSFDLPCAQGRVSSSEAMDTSHASTSSTSQPGGGSASSNVEDDDLFPGFHFDLDRPAYTTTSTDTSLLHTLSVELTQWMFPVPVHVDEEQNQIHIRSICLEVEEDVRLKMGWNHEDQLAADQCLSVVRDVCIRRYPELDLLHDQDVLYPEAHLDTCSDPSIASSSASSSSSSTTSTTTGILPDRLETETSTGSEHSGKRKR